MMNRLTPLFVLCLAGCKNGTSTIAGAAVGIRRNAESSRDRFLDAGISEGVKEQDSIISATEQVALALPNVQEKPSEWMDLLELGAIAAICIAVVVLVWQLGLGTLIRTMIGWIPQKKQSAAKLLREAADDNDPTSIREAIAAIRVMDPELDAAYKKDKK